LDIDETTLAELLEKIRQNPPEGSPVLSTEDLATLRALIEHRMALIDLAEQGAELLELTKYHIELIQLGTRKRKVNAATSLVFDTTSGMKWLLGMLATAALFQTEFREILRAWLIP
jgi:hypothetical protein